MPVKSEAESNESSPATLDLPEAAAAKTKDADEHHLLKGLRELGVLLTSGAVVGAFGKLFGLSDAQVAGLTLSLVAILYVIVHRQTIQRRLPSSTLLVAVLVTSLIAAVFSEKLLSLLLSHTIGRSTGIVGYQAKANDFLPRIGEYIAKAEEEVWFTGISFYITVPANKDAILKKLQEGVSVRFLIYNPLSTNLEEVAAGFSQTKEELFSECDVTIQNLRTLLNSAKQQRTKATLDVRLFSSIPKARIYVFDRRRETGFTYFIPHIDQQNSPNLPGFLVRNIKTGITPAYIEGIERLWNTSIEFEPFLKTYDVERQKVLSRPPPTEQRLSDALPALIEGTAVHGVG